MIGAIEFLIALTESVIVGSKCAGDSISARLLQNKCDQKDAEMNMLEERSRRIRRSYSQEELDAFVDIDLRIIMGENYEDEFDRLFDGGTYSHFHKHEEKGEAIIGAISDSRKGVFRGYNTPIYWHFSHMYFPIYHPDICRKNEIFFRTAAVMERNYRNNGIFTFHSSIDYGQTYHNGTQDVEIRPMCMLYRPSTSILLDERTTDIAELVRRDGNLIETMTKKERKQRLNGTK